MNHFLLKTEPTEYSIDDLKHDKVTSWFGVRNYQARNIIRDEMKKGDTCIIYHSSCEVPSAVGIGKIIKEAYGDTTQFDSTSAYFDPTSKKENPRWLSVDVAFVKRFTTPVPLSIMRAQKKLEGMRLLARGNRLSVMQLSEAHYNELLKLAK